MTEIIEEKKLKYEGVKGIAHIRDVGNSVRHPTASWRIFKPIIDYKKCIGCKTCFTLCPDSAIRWEKKKPNKDSKLVGRPTFDYDVCKGCGVCWTDCPVKAIRAERDVK
jgi:2-oxoacid:acceptor oxidoreductase delta subunit (pyruvate/2-ketoisovalerate family)